MRISLGVSPQMLLQWTAKNNVNINQQSKANIFNGQDDRALLMAAKVKDNELVRGDQSLLQGVELSYSSVCLYLELLHSAGAITIDSYDEINLTPIIYRLV